MAQVAVLAKNLRRRRAEATQPLSFFLFYSHQIVGRVWPYLLDLTTLWLSFQSARSSTSVLTQRDHSSGLYLRSDSL